jgi:hypothetical protein
MRRANCLLVILALFAATQIAGVRASSYRDQVTQQAPQITSARIKGKKLIVTGVNFSENAVILVDGEAVATVTDPENPSTYLVAKKGGKRIAPETMASISVQNNTGVTSPPFEVFSGLVITFDDDGKTFGIAVGSKFQVVLQKASYEWAPATYDPTYIEKLSNELLLPGSIGVFQSKLAGTTQISSFGELPCAKVTPPCLAPALGFRVTLNMKDLN